MRETVSRTHMMQTVDAAVTKARGEAERRGVEVEEEQSQSGESVKG